MAPKSLHPELKLQLRALYESAHIHVAPVQVQRGVTDCGCFAVAFAVSLMYSDSPALQTYCQRKMRKHIMDCYMNANLIPFPSAMKSTKKTQPFLELNF